MTRRKQDAQPPLERLQKKPLPPHSKLLLPVIAGASGGLLTLAVPDLIGADGLIDYLKCGVIGAAATFTAYTVNRFALEKGAFQAAIGSIYAALTSTVSVLAVGAGFFAATYAGFVKNETDRLRLQDYNAEYSAWLDQRVSAVQGTNSGGATLQAILSDLAAKVACEATSSCVSGVGHGGKGPAFRNLSGTYGSAEAIAAQLSGAEAAKADALAQLGGLQGAMRGVLSDGSLSASERRLQAQAITREAASLLSVVEDDAPSGMLAGFGAQLMQRGSSTPQDRLLASYGSQLVSAASPVRTSGMTPPPAFPMETGVADTLRFIPHFLPVALLVAVCELILPMTLWLYTFIDLRVRLEQQERAAKRPQRRRPPTNPKS
ncbi:hypothetical protein BYZ73_00485 [Rhodovulum viride]|uniref:Uncharacterized protein n=2 Tax=Rhodovulum viride TaxID=1231134 RepID=A0ABX9DPR0_9RHOB|nr:hypothetical protein BYZ73_00485 [Rhodovulum viride]